jgi:hypothetical protein
MRKEKDDADDGRDHGSNEKSAGNLSTTSNSDLGTEHAAHKDLQHGKLVLDLYPALSPKTISDVIGLSIRIWPR